MASQGVSFNASRVLYMHARSFSDSSNVDSGLSLFAFFSMKSEIKSAHVMEYTWKEEEERGETVR
jgi:hypothetical protein